MGQHVPKRKKSLSHSCSDNSKEETPAPESEEPTPAPASAPESEEPLNTDLCKGCHRTFKQILQHLNVPRNSTCKANYDMDSFTEQRKKEIQKRKEEKKQKQQNKQSDTCRGCNKSFQQ